MKPVVVSRRARLDLRGIGDVIAADDPSRARSLISDLRSRYQALGQRLLMGGPAPEIAPDVRILVFHAGLILHRVFDDRISIDRVVHSARDRSTVSPNE